MPHVITQSCCNDGSCVFACPVNCIHPTPDEPGFAVDEPMETLGERLALPPFLESRRAQIEAGLKPIG